MKVSIHANLCDQETQHVAKALHEPFKALGKRFSDEYDGVMEHLWIDFELVEPRPDLGKKRPWPFRFQKRVSGRSHFGLPPSPDKFNVGHFSVMPNFQLLLSLPQEQLIRYVLAQIYNSTAILIEKQKKLGGFNAERFRSNFLSSCEALGYGISSNPLQPFNAADRAF